MLTKGHYFPEQQRDEEVIKFTRRHWMSFVWPWGIILFIFFATCIVAIAVALIYNTEQVLSEAYREYYIIGASVSLLVIAGLFLNAWINYYLDVTILTTNHLVDIRLEGLFNRRVSEQTLLRVQDVSSRMRGILQTFFRYGAVFVETAGEAPNFAMQNIPRPYKLANEIMRLHEELVERGEFHKSLAEADGVIKLNKSKDDDNQKIIPLREIKTTKDHYSSRFDNRKVSLGSRLTGSLRENVIEEIKDSEVGENSNKENIDKGQETEEGNLEEGEIIEL